MQAVIASAHKNQPNVQNKIYFVDNYTFFSSLINALLSTQRALWVNEKWEYSTLEIEKWTLILVPKFTIVKSI